MKVDFATFCYGGDKHRLQLERQVLSNHFAFSEIIVVFQQTEPLDFSSLSFNVKALVINDIQKVLDDFNIPLNGQYTSNTDKHHWWANHVVNHLKAVQNTTSDFIVFADNDCWMISNGDFDNWVTRGIGILSRHPEVLIVSPNDGEPERKTDRFSQQMFLARTNEFRAIDFNQPGWDGNVNIPGGPMPEYHAMLEGRLAHYAKSVGKYRYVLGPNYRYWHHNRLDSNGQYETDYSRY